MKILKRLFIVSILLFCGLFSSGQDEYKPYFALGIKQGVNYSSVDFSPGVKTNPHFGYQAGLIFKYQNERLFALQIELNYSQKGWTEKLDTIDNSYKRSLDYIELPLITQIVLGKKNLKYYVNLGTSFGYYISEKESLEVNNELYRREYYEKKVQNNFDYSVLGEAGILFSNKIGEFQIGVRYQLTFTDLFNVGETSIYTNSQNTLWNFSIGYFFLNNK
ncbi:MAG: hypothetical protein C0597_12630 [Marinilabiliales bacterium]|nr:MAG: hypothetical protein C0597_12630 [Marinilabiliales bacterium]